MGNAFQRMGGSAAGLAKNFPQVGVGKKKVLIVSSHPNVIDGAGKSFNHKLLDTAKAMLEAEGHAVIIDDLVAIGWNPVASPADFTAAKDPTYFDYQSEQDHAVQGGTFAPDLREQLDLVDWCDIIIHQFPIYWWSVPAIHKGWIDRCLVWHYSYPANKSKWVNKQWMCSVTIGPPVEVATRPGTKENPGGGLPYQNLLAHVALGTPVMCGMEPVPMFMVGPAAATPEQKEEMCKEYVDHLRKFVCGSKEDWYTPRPDPKWSASICMQTQIPGYEVPKRLEASLEDGLGIMDGPQAQRGGA